jgi:hypothetical protein
MQETIPLFVFEIQPHSWHQEVASIRGRRTYLFNRNRYTKSLISKTCRRYKVYRYGKGCTWLSQTISDSVWVRVYPIIKADAGPADTSVVIGQPLLLNGTRGTSYVWSPPTWLNNPNIATPISLPEDNITYTLVVSSPAGCKGTDSIHVKLFKVPASFYVPSGFSPNNDRNNDIMRPILIGMRSLKLFRSTTDGDNCYLVLLK